MSQPLGESQGQYWSDVEHKEHIGLACEESGDSSSEIENQLIRSEAFGENELYRIVKEENEMRRQQVAYFDNVIDCWRAEADHEWTSWQPKKKG